MAEITRILEAINGGDAGAADQLLPLIYDELRRLAAQKLAGEKPGQTLQATALVHEAYIRLVGTEDQNWDGRGHFFAAAAEAMRRILVENARRKQQTRYGGVGEIDMSLSNELSRAIVKFALAGISQGSTNLEDATLRVYVRH